MSRANLQFQHDNAVMPVAVAAPTVLWRDGAEMILQCYGITVPGGVAGYATGCIFHHTDGGANDAVYINEGTATTANFVEVGAA